MSKDRRAVRIAAGQGGVLRSDQAAECGFTKGQIDQRVRDGRWSAMGRFGWVIVDMPGSMNLVRAAVATLPEAVVSHDTAAELHGLSKLRRGVASVMVHSRTTHVFPGVIVRRCHDLRPEHIVEVSELPVTTVARTVVDLAPLITSKHLAAVLESAVVEQQVRIEDVAEVVDQISRRGKPGMRKIRSILDDRSAGPRNGTPLERAGARVLSEYGLPEPRFEYPTPWDATHRFDAAYPNERLAIEWDSRRWHELREAFATDRERDRRALVLGWRVVRFTWSDVKERPSEVADTVVRLLGAPDHGPPSDPRADGVIWEAENPGYAV